MAERFLVTGANGCIGAWVVKQLLEQGVEVTAFDLKADEHRHLLINEGVMPKAKWAYGDLTVAKDVEDAMTGVTHVIHLAALQVPFCRANPALGANVNVVGTVNIFEAAKKLGVNNISHASSIAVFGLAADYPDEKLASDAQRLPTTLYGVYKTAAEDVAKVYWSEYGIRSVGLRPHTVFGPGRDQGMTSQPSVAIEKAVLKEKFHVEYGGVLDFQYAPDVASAFILAARTNIDGAPVVNINGHVVGVSDFVEVVKAVTGFKELSYGTTQLPVVYSADSQPWIDLASPPPLTNLQDAIATSVRIFSNSSPTN
ncbi:MAG: SDR family oxidoreductase [Acidimicrobiaceae bacterium]|nr:SDR family oxidoreductase [Acidimicrobiaceae bacterium]